MNREDPTGNGRARCPRCDRKVAWYGNPHRPFCSLRCRLIDLGVWLDERYRIPGPEIPSESAAGADDQARESG